MPLIAGIYFIVNTNNGKVYVGSSKRPKNRWLRSHRMLLRGGRHINRYLQRSWNKHGEEAFLFEIVERCRIADLPEREKFYVDFLTRLGVPLYNGTQVIDNRWTLPEQTKQKMREANLGKRYSEEARKNMSLGQLARYADPEEGPRSRAMLSRTSKGRVMPPEARERIRAFQLARYADPETGAAARAAAGSAFKGKTRIHSPETCEKIRQTLLRKNRG